MIYNLNRLTSHGEYYRTKEEDYELKVWLCLENGKAYTTRRIFENFQYSDMKEIEVSGAFLPLYRTDVVELEEQYLREVGGEAIVRDYMEKNRYGGDFSACFRAYVEDYGYLGIDDKWFEILKAALRRDAIAWCAENNLEWNEEPLYDHSKDELVSDYIKRKEAEAEQAKKENRNEDI